MSTKLKNTVLEYTYNCEDRKPPESRSLYLCRLSTPYLCNRRVRCFGERIVAIHVQVMP